MAPLCRRAHLSNLGWMGHLGNLAPHMAMSQRLDKHSPLAQPLALARLTCRNLATPRWASHMSTS